MAASGRVTQDCFNKAIDEGIIFDDLKDVHVTKRIIYITGDTFTCDGGVATYAYKDKDCTIKMSADELFDVFVKGAFIYNTRGIPRLIIGFAFTPATDVCNYSAIVVNEGGIVSLEAVPDETN